MTLWNLQRTCLPDMVSLLFRGSGKPARAFRWWGSQEMRGSALSLFYFIYHISRRDLQRYRFNHWLINGMLKRRSMLLQLLPQYLSWTFQLRGWSRKESSHLSHD